MHLLWENGGFASIIAICRSATIFDYKEDAKLEARSRELKANQYVSKGKIGNRTYKGTDQVFNERKKIKDVRGSHYSKLVISKTIERNKELETKTDDEERQSKKKINIYLTSVESEFNSIRNECTVEKYAYSLLYEDEETLSQTNATKNKEGSIPQHT